MFKLLFTPLITFLLTLPLQALEIRDKLSVEEVLKPNLYELTIEVKTSGKTEGEVLNTLSAVDNGIKMLNIPYSGGYFRVYPKKVWDENLKRYRQEGFEGVVFYTFKYKNLNRQKEVFELLENIKRNYPITYSVVRENWSVSDRVLERVEEKLKEELLREAKLKAKEYGRILNKSCTIKELRFKESYTSIYPPESSKDVITPKRENEVVKITASVVFDCR